MRMVQLRRWRQQRRVFLLAAKQVFKYLGLIKADQSKTTNVALNGNYIISLGSQLTHALTCVHLLSLMQIASAPFNGAFKRRILYIKPVSK